MFALQGGVDLRELLKDPLLIFRRYSDAGVGKVSRVEASYVLNKVEFHPDLFYYGIHGVEALYAVMGTGCVSVSRRVTADSDVTTCRWRDGRVGVYHGLPKADPARPLLTVIGEAGTVSTKDAANYDGIVRVIAEAPSEGAARALVARSREPLDALAG